MERVYAVGVSIIEFVQEWLSSYDHYFELVNDLANPHYVLEYLFPMVSIVDSVFAAQLLLCLGFGGWLNAVMKWWLQEDRPYWWIRETDFYSTDERPVLRQFRQTCETGPGSPSGHTKFTAMMLVLIVCWISHIMNDRKYNITWLKYIIYPLCGITLTSVMLARIFIGTHFPHQVVFGAFVGAFLAPALCIYVSDPYIWQYDQHANKRVKDVMSWHVAAVILTIVIGFATYFGLKFAGIDPMWTVKLAFKWCESPEHIHVSTTPMFALVQSTGHLLGWALSVTPAVAQYRHYTKNRSLILSAIVVSLILYSYNFIWESICKDDAIRYYAVQFALCAIKPALLLRFAPKLAMWPFSPSKTKVE